jgi:alkylation response protein AidB-like acyl-CoA dehydrogenase
LASEERAARMEFRLRDEQLALQDAVRRLCAERFPVEQIAAREGQPADRATWRALVELGIFGLLAPESDGLDVGMIEAVIAFEQLGAHLVSGPVLWTTLAARYVDGAARGDRRVSGVADDGAPPFVVEHAAEIDALLVLRDDGAFVCQSDDLPRFAALAPLDPLTPVGCCGALPRGACVADARDAASLRTAGTVLCAALALGVSDAALEVARRYALDRQQFGVPIGSFQAIQHLLADMYVRTALARSATYAAAAVIDDPEIGDPTRASAEAKLLAGEAAVENARAAVQIHGGVGFTWEMLPNYLLKRAWVLEQSFGDADSHAFAIGAAIEGAPA